MKKNTTKVILLCLVVMLAFFAGFLLNQTNIKRLESLIGRKDGQIKMLTEQVLVKQNELDTIKDELTTSKNALDKVIKELDNVNNKLKTLVVSPVTVTE